MKKIISIILVTLTILSCFSCLASAKPAYPYHKNPATIKEDEFGYGNPSFDFDDEHKTILYTTGSLKALEQYASDVAMKIFAPFLYVFQLITVKFAVKILTPQYDDYDVIELTNDEFYLGYIGEGNFNY